MGILDSLTPKKILFDAISDKLKDSDIVKITLIFVLDTDKYNIMVSSAEGKNTKVDITFDEITTIKKLFIRRIVAKWNERYDIDAKSVIVEVDVISKELNVFIQTYNEKVLKFDY